MNKNKDILRKIRFHDLRHSCASLLLAKGIPMKEIQDWLGHSTYSTTANIYAHLEKDTKNKSANVLSNILIIGTFLQTISITKLAYKLSKNKYGYEVYNA